MFTTYYKVIIVLLTMIKIFYEKGFKFKYYPKIKQDTNQTLTNERRYKKWKELYE